MKSDAKALNAAVENYVQAMKDKGKIDSDVNVDDYLVSDNASGGQSQTTQQGDNQQSASTAENGKSPARLNPLKQA